MTEEERKLRDQFAAQAMNGLLQSNPPMTMYAIASQSYAIADAMLEQRSTGNNGNTSNPN